MKKFFTLILVIVMIMSTSVQSFGCNGKDNAQSNSEQHQPDSSIDPNTDSSIDPNPDSSVDPNTDSSSDRDSDIELPSIPVNL